MLRVLAILGLIAALRLGVSETLFRRDTIEAVRRAIAIQDSAVFEERLAELDPKHAREALQRAVAVDRRASGAWMSLAMEKDLLEAARVDHQFLPAWTLCNFYFRAGNQKAFWTWAARAVVMTYDDFRPLLRLCDQFESDPDRLLEHLGGSERLRLAYLDFLIGENRLDAAQVLARGLMRDRSNDPHLIDLADRQLRAGNAEAAMELWNAASGFPAIGPSQGRMLTNGDLARAPLNLGFDWRLGQTNGVVQAWKPMELTFTFTGTEPEACVLLEQTVWVTPGRFRLHFDYRTSIAPTAGVHWGMGTTESASFVSTPVWTEGTFDLPRTRGLAELKLFYRREPGTTRTEGRIELRNLRVEAS